MKRIVFLMCALLSLAVASAQKMITVTTDRTTNLLFNAAIVHADRGTKDVLVQIIPESDRVILIKAACRNFHPTSLSVLTADGNLYSFIVSYDSLPATLVYNIVPETKVGIREYAASLINRPGFLHGIKDRSWGICLRAAGIYIKDSVLFFQYNLYNSSTISYDIDQLRFYIKDKRKGKRTTVQENEKVPLYVQGHYTAVNAGAELQLVFAFEKFTIPDAKVFVTEITERNGGRNLKLKVNNRKLMKAKPLNDLIN